MAERVLLALPALLGVIVLSFLLIHFVPGDPVENMLGEQAAEADKAGLRAELGLDLPWTTQLARHMGDLARFDLGVSLTSRDSVAAEIFSHLPATIELSLAALGLAILWALPLGVWSAVKPRSFWGWSAEAFGLLGMSVPGIFLGPALVFAFAVQFDWFPVSERGGLDHLALPALSLAIPLGSVILRMTRAAMFEVMHEDYIRTARAKGAGEKRIYFRHALRNALVPIVTVLTLQLGALLTGTVITETIFDWPGIGSVLYAAIQRRDYPVVQGAILVVAIIYVLVNLLGDLLYAVVNPRVRLGGGA